MWWWGFGAGFMVGGGAGIVLMCLMSLAKEAEDERPEAQESDGG